MYHKKTIPGNVTFSPGDFAILSNLAKEGIKSRSIINDFKEKVSSLVRKITGLEKKLEVYESKGITAEMKIQQAIRHASRRFAEVIADILRKPPEREMGLPEKHKSIEKIVRR